ncbi:EthD family reductase [Marinobacter sp. CHS3-4]|uniref:EthD family reductase n=1 Tax=Marinobacter sp. CHS3-4 TaxID=3045174 RepID=UPI0024B50807|nr:EthD family reductase [Marinobacter sp. CHS3-4]MDI9243831.1 EthD family reductase [Marinobacter sp. CHS3-4]
MIKVSVYYPNDDDTEFDVQYYQQQHLPLLRSKLGDFLLDDVIEVGICGAHTGEKPAFVAAGHLYFESVESFQKAFAPHMKQIQSDIPNYTNARPLLQVSEVFYTRESSHA